VETRPSGKWEKSGIKGNNKTFSQKRLQIVSGWTYLKKKEFFTQALSRLFFSHDFLASKGRGLREEFSGKE